MDDNLKSNFTSCLSTHADVYVKTAKHSTFANTTPHYQKTIAADLITYLLNMDQRLAYGQNEITSKITEFNKNNGRVKIVPPIANFAKGTLQLYFTFDGEAYDYVTYTPIKDEN